MCIRDRYEAVSLWKAEKVMRDMAPVAAAHAKWEKEKEWEKALAEDLNVWEKGSGHWQKMCIRDSSKTACRFFIPKITTSEPKFASNCST